MTRKAFAPIADLALFLAVELPSKVKPSVAMWLCTVGSILSIYISIILVHSFAQTSVHTRSGNAVNMPHNSIGSRDII